MDFNEISNPWSHYELPDGTKIRIRHVLTSVKHTGTNDDGSLRYDCSFSAIAVTEPVTQTGPVPFSPIEPHIYSPDYQAMGDCRVCGHGPEKPWHRYSNAANALGVLTEMPLIKKTDLQ